MCCLQFDRRLIDRNDNFIWLQNIPCIHNPRLALRINNNHIARQTCDCYRLSDDLRLHTAPISRGK
ncbi:Uncharacterised protein [Vibrio cholerae]|nr:Uncharacterised protein [Vibrio cholerae]CSB73594.1 Uncharacterised protein [Vibrio cholerae]CSC12970.1 Uncharacterised protein [Vibrio cholerae]